MNMKVFKKEIIFASKQCNSIMEEKKLYCAVGEEMPWERMKMNSGMTVL